MKTPTPLQRLRYGGVLISALAFVTVASALVVGMLTLSVSYYARAVTESDYEAALGVAEAGVNYELRKLSNNTNNADQSSVANPAGPSYTLGSGAFTVYCSNKDGSTPWVAPNPLYVNATGTVHGVRRSVLISAKGYDWNGHYAIYSMDHLSTWNGSSISIVGDVGTNNQLSFSGSPGISGTVFFNGPSAGWSGGVPLPGYTVVTNSQPQTWATVDEIALKKYPAGTYGSGGLLWIASHNSNAGANPPIVGNSVTNGVTLVGPGDYYLTHLDLHGNEKITFNNTNGPVNIWLGPSGGTGTAIFRGGTGAISAVTDPSKINNIYVATNSAIDLAGNETIDAVIYAYNKTSTGTAFGNVQFSGNPNINGQVLGNQVDVNGNVDVNYVQGPNKPTNFGYWGFDDQWQELNGM